MRQCLARFYYSQEQAIIKEDLRSSIVNPDTLDRVFRFLVFLLWSEYSKTESDISSEIIIRNSPL